MILSAPKLLVHSFGLSDPGRVREKNQDRILLDDDLGLYLVSDGVGGRAGGEIAAELTVETVRREIREQRGRSRPMAPASDAEEEFSSQTLGLIRAVEAANRVVRDTAESRDELRGMSATLAAVLVSRDGVAAANVGDSPIMLFRDSGAAALSVEHTLAAQAASGDADRPAGDSHTLTRAVGAGEQVRPDACETPIFPGDKIILCTDGLSRKLALPEMEDALSSRTLQEACATLVNLANKRGGEDNISLIGLEVSRAGLFKRIVSTLFKRRNSPGGL